MNTGWDDFHRRWQGLAPPLRPHATVVSAIAGEVAGRDDHVLLLGMTPELAGIGRNVTAIDWAQEAIARIWPGDDARRRALCADWRTTPLPAGTVSAAIGDGSINTLCFADDYRSIFAELGRIVRPGGRIVLRCYLTPDRCESLPALRRAVLAGGMGFHAFKWRLAMALAAEAGEPNVAFDTIYRAFETMFPDRGALSRESGWSAGRIDEIDAYRASPTRMSFPTAAQMIASVPQPFTAARLVAAGDYELAERCPLLIAERR